MGNAFVDVLVDMLVDVLVDMLVDVLVDVPVDDVAAAETVAEEAVPLIWVGVATTGPVVVEVAVEVAEVAVEVDDVVLGPTILK